MKMNIKKLLEEYSLKISEETIAYYPQFGEEETLDFSEIVSKFNGRYAVNNSTICFIIEGEAYVTPYTRGMISIIEDIGLKQADFYAPFSNWDYPLNEKDKWEDLRKKAEKKTAQEFADECFRLSWKKGLREISSGALENCLSIPPKGLEVKHNIHNYRGMIMPVITSSIADSMIEKALGTYSANNGVVVFAYCDGNTYLTKGYKIIAFLDQAGFEKTDMFVPLSNGEELTNPVMQLKWLNISKNNF